MFKDLNLYFNQKNNTSELFPKRNTSVENLQLPFTTRCISHDQNTIRNENEEQYTRIKQNTMQQMSYFSIHTKNNTFTDLVQTGYNAMFAEIRLMKHAGQESYFFDNCLA